jgi:catechol 2,3-dioxygenase-like lactoylglutathione lyase family enzyme
VVPVARVNTILYCTEWAATVGFYRDQLELPVEFANDWFVEFALGDAAFVSVADARRSTIDAGDGRGITLSWEVADVRVAGDALRAVGVDVSTVTRRFGSEVIDLFDPAGNRIELWARSG